MSKEVIEMINSNPALFGLGAFYGVIVYMVCACIPGITECAAYYRDKRKELKNKQKEEEK